MKICPNFTKICS